MKAFVSALILVIIITGLAVFDYIYSKTYFDKLEKYIDQTPESIDDTNIPEDLKEQVKKIEEVWDKYKKYLVATINYQQISIVSVAILDFKSVVLENGSSYEYGRARETLIVSLKNLRRYTVTSLESIF